MMPRRMLAGVIVAAAVLAVPANAGAHVTVNPPEAAAGGFAKLTFRVPNERDDAGTTSVEINLPEDHPIAFVSVKPTPGWQYSVERRTLEEPIESHGTSITEVVAKVTFSGGRIAPGEFQEFDLSVGPLPEDAEMLEFPAIQTYENGAEVVRWIEEPLEDGSEPERPAPVLALLPPTEDDHGGGAAEPAEGEEAAGDSAAADDGDDGTDALTVVALVVGGLGVVLGALALLRRRAG